MITPRECLSKIVPYKPGRSIADVQAEIGHDRVIKLASNENPFGCPISPADLTQIIESVAMYPDIASSTLLDELSLQWGVNRSQIILGNGSDEILTMIGLAYLNPGDRVLTARETFSEYGFVAHLMDAHLDQVPLTDFRFDLSHMINAIQPTTQLIFIANPNNPTGTILRHSEFYDFMTQVPSHIGVIIDEAYIEFVDDSEFPRSIEMVSEFPNLIVTRTFSKLYGLAGFRIGYAIAHEEVIQTLYKVRQPFNVNSVALAAASMALKKTEFISQTLQNNRVERARLQAAFEIHGYRVLESHANFICIHIGPEAKVFVSQLLAAGIIVRHLESFGMPAFVRITIGTSEQNGELMAAMDVFFQK